MSSPQPNEGVSGGSVAGKQGFSGIRPPDDGGTSRPTTRRERLVRMAPPANDNRGHGISLGRLRFTGLRLVVGIVLGACAALLAYGTGLL
jgi:hypothetical protein